MAPAAELACREDAANEIVLCSCVSPVVLGKLLLQSPLRLAITCTKRAICAEHVPELQIIAPHWESSTVTRSARQLGTKSNAPVRLGGRIKTDHIRECAMMKGASHRHRLGFSASCERQFSASGPAGSRRQVVRLTSNRRVRALQESEIFRAPAADISGTHETSRQALVPAAACLADRIDKRSQRNPADVAVEP